MVKDEEMAVSQGRRLSQVANELFSLIQRVRAMERRVSALEDHILIFMSGQERKRGEREE